MNDKQKEWIYALTVLVVCALISRFLLKDRVHPDHYAPVSFGLLALTQLITYPLFRKLNRSKD